VRLLSSISCAHGFRVRREIRRRSAPPCRASPLLIHAIFPFSTRGILDVELPQVGEGLLRMSGAGPWYGRMAARQEPRQRALPIEGTPPGEAARRLPQESSLVVDQIISLSRFALLFCASEEVINLEPRVVCSVDQNLSSEHHQCIWKITEGTNMITRETVTLFLID
jgi:hypothetical protein